MIFSAPIIQEPFLTMKKIQWNSLHSIREIPVYLEKKKQKILMKKSEIRHFFDKNGFDFQSGQFF